jgi:hypothetical protein
MRYTALLIRAACAAIVILGARCATAAQHPFFSFHFGTYDGGGWSHSDTFDITALKPVRTLNLSLTSSDPGHSPGAEFLLDFTGATILNSTNDAHVLSISVEYPDPGLLGSFVAARITFPEIYHDTIAESAGTFVDGTTFSTLAQVGFVPEPSSVALLLSAGAAMIIARRRRARPCRVIA